MISIAEYCLFSGASYTVIGRCSTRSKRLGRRQSNDDHFNVITNVDHYELAAATCPLAAACSVLLARVGQMRCNIDKHGPASLPPSD